MQLQTFHEQLISHYNLLAKNDNLLKMRAKAWDQYLSIGLPSAKTEVFRYIPLKLLLDRPYEISVPTSVSMERISKYIYPECRHSVLVFVNGHYQEKLSNTSSIPTRVVISPLAEAMNTYGTFLNNQWNKFLKEETDPFAIINTALHRDGLFLYIPPKTLVAAPIQILHIIDNERESTLMMPRLNVFVGSHSQVTMASSFAVLSASQSHYTINSLTDFAIEEGAHVIQMQAANHETPNAWHLDFVRASLKRNSNFKNIHATNGSATVRHDYRVELTGENAEASLNGIWMLHDKREAHTHVLVDHQAPSCRSFQLYKGVVDDMSRSSFEGKIYVRQQAQKTDAFQLNNNLILSDRAQANSKPNLEIFADDVKASHGATVGQLDPEQLFYMKTRGFSEKIAKNLLVHSFCQQVIDLIPLPSLSQAIQNQFKRSL